MSGDSRPRRPLHERSESDTNTAALAAVRLVPATPPRRLNERDDVFSRTPLPTHPAHFLSPGGKGRGRDDVHTLQHHEFQRPRTLQKSTASRGSTTLTTHQPPEHDGSAAESSVSKPKPVPKKRLRIHQDQKTFSLVPEDHPQAVLDTPISPTLSTKSLYNLLSSTAHNGGVRSNSITLCISDASSTSAGPPTTPVPASKEAIPADPIASTNSPWNYQLVGGLRKVPETPDLKQKAAVTLDSPLRPLPESDTANKPRATSHNLSAKPSFQSESTESATTASENTNYKVYQGTSAPNSDTALAPPSSSNSDRLPGDPSPASSVIIRRPQTASSENENYELLGSPSPSASYDNLGPRSKYSQESLVVPPLNPRAPSSNVNLGYYKSRSRESLRTGSLTSLSTVLSQQEAARAIVGSGSLIQLPILAANLKRTSSWAKPLASHPLRSFMNETPHQWSSQLSTVPSVSEGGTDRGSRTWSDDPGRRSSGAFQSSQSRHSRQMLSISSSLAAEEAASRSTSDSLEPPSPAFARNGQRFPSGSSGRIVGEQDEHGDGITDMQDLRGWPTRTRLSGLDSVSDNARSNSILSTSSSRANSLLASSIPTWARLYYGSGERRFWGVGAPGSSTEGGDSRASSFRSFRNGSPNTDHFPLSLYSPRRRPREINSHRGQPDTRSMEITPAAQLGGDGRLMHETYPKHFRTWSMSSIWSPHLRLDRRATRHSIWEPPSVNWSTEGSWFGRRNVQIIMFSFGWIFPFGKIFIPSCSIWQFADYS